jgi:hypothetical protein
MIGVLEEILSYISLTTAMVTLFTYLKHPDRPLKGGLVEFAHTGQGFNAPVHEVRLWHIFPQNYDLLTIKYKGRKCPPPRQRRRRTRLCCSDKQGSTWQVLRANSSTKEVRLDIRSP